MSRLLIISPHLDDAALSCGARIVQTARSGGEVVVVTCFTSPGESATEEYKQIYRQRKADDNNALNLVGAGCRHLGLTDAPFRNPKYYNFNTILFHHRLPEEENPLVSRLIVMLKELADEWRPDEILFPLGVGGHIDHHHVWESSQSFWDGPHTISYYEDLPYALVPGWSAVRRHWLGKLYLSNANDQETGVRQNPPEKANPLDQDIVKIALSQIPYPFVANYMPSLEDRALSTEKYDREYEGIETRLWNTGHWIVNGKVAVRNLYYIGEEVFSTKCRAIACYASEWPVLFGPHEKNIREMLMQSPNTGQYAEISWTIKTTR